MLGDVATGIECMEMHDAKGLEFRAIAIVGCDDGVVPDEQRLLTAKDEAALDEIIATERHLLYVAFSRARERVWLSSSGAPSEFISDLLE
jgi:superfamily I DNA/RNA helicase